MVIWGDLGREQTIIHYGWIPLIIYIGFTRSNPQPSLIKYVSLPCFIFVPLRSVLMCWTQVDQPIGLGHSTLHPPNIQSHLSLSHPPSVDIIITTTSQPARCSCRSAASRITIKSTHRNGTPVLFFFLFFLSLSLFYSIPFPP